MPAPEAVSDAELRAADGIYTTDPDNPHAAGHQLWGVRTAPSSQPQTAAEQRLVEIELPSDDHVGLLRLIDRIERVKGSLGPDTAELRKNLSG